MRLLLDECLPKRLKSALRDACEVATVQEAGWAGLADGDLLECAQGRFDLLLTADQNLRYQQNLQRESIAVVVLVASSSRLDDLLPLIPHVKSAIPGLKAGEMVCIDIDGVMKG